MPARATGQASDVSQDFLKALQGVHEALEQKATLAEAWAQIRATLPDVPDAVLRELVAGALGGDIFDEANPPAAGTLRAKFWKELTARLGE